MTRGERLFMGFLGRITAFFCGLLVVHFVNAMLQGNWGNSSTLAAGAIIFGFVSLGLFAVEGSS